MQTLYWHDHQTSYGGAQQQCLATLETSDFPHALKRSFSIRKFPVLSLLIDLSGPFMLWEQWVMWSTFTTEGRRIQENQHPFKYTSYNLPKNQSTTSSINLKIGGIEVALFESMVLPQLMRQLLLDRELCNGSLGESHTLPELTQR